jgi:UDP-N-acetylmuramyl pentapeptide synthase
MNLIPGIKRSWIIDDSYNAAPLSMEAALDALAELQAQRKIAVLGEMREIGKYQVKAHQAVGEEVSKIASCLITVGEAGKIIAKEAKSQGLDNIYSFKKPEEAGKKLQEIIKEGDLVLVKASRSIYLEKVVLEVMAQPELADEVLVH